MKAKSSSFRKATKAKFTDIGKLVSRFQELAKKLDAQLNEMETLEHSIISLWLQNKATLRNLLSAGKKDPLRIQEYRVREQLLKNAKDLVDYRINKVIQR